MLSNQFKLKILPNDPHDFIQFFFKPEADLTTQTKILKGPLKLEWGFRIFLGGGGVGGRCRYRPIDKWGL